MTTPRGFLDFHARFPYTGLKMEIERLSTTEEVNGFNPLSGRDARAKRLYHLSQEAKRQFWLYSGNREQKDKEPLPLVFGNPAIVQFIYTDSDTAARAVGKRLSDAAAELSATGVAFDDLSYAEKEDLRRELVN